MKSIRMGDRTYVVDEANGCAYSIDNKVLDSIMDLRPISLPKIRHDRLTSDEFDVDLVPEFHEPVMLINHRVELFPHDRYRLNNDLIRIFGTKMKRDFRPIIPWFQPIRVQNQHLFMSCAAS